MTQKERLANLLDEFWLEHFDSCNTDAMTEHLLSNGVIVPPCKVGDTVYKIGFTPCTKYGDYPYSSLCDGCMTPCDSHRTIVTYVAPTNTWIVREFIDNVERHYFTTREEAEQALKERGE